VKGLVFLGTSGSDIGTVGHMMAFQTRMQEVWSFDMYRLPDRLQLHGLQDPGRSRLARACIRPTRSIPRREQLYVPTGNPGPDFVGDYRPGDNLYTCSVIMLDARTGSFKGYHQFVPHDVHDWDIAASPILYTAKSGRKM